jgi:hypothetical protein
VSAALASLAGFFEAQAPRIQAVIENLKAWIESLKVFFAAAFNNDIPGMLQALGGVFEAFVPLVGSALDAFVAGVGGAVDLVLAYLGGVIDGIGTFASSWGGNFVTAATAVQTFVANVKSAMDGIGGAIQGAIDWVQKLIDKFLGVKLPPLLTPGSPTPFEMGLRGITDALREMDHVGFPGVIDSAGYAPTPALAMAGAGSASGGPVSINFNGALTLDSPQRVRELADEISRILGEQLQARRI